MLDCSIISRCFRVFLVGCLVLDFVGHFLGRLRVSCCSRAQVSLPRTLGAILSVGCGTPSLSIRLIPVATMFSTGVLLCHASFHEDITLEIRTTLGITFVLTSSEKL